MIPKYHYSTTEKLHSVQQTRHISKNRKLHSGLICSFSTGDTSLLCGLVKHFQTQNLSLHRKWMFRTSRIANYCVYIYHKFYSILSNVWTCMYVCMYGFSVCPFGVKYRRRFQIKPTFTTPLRTNSLPEVTFSLVKP